MYIKNFFFNKTTYFSYVFLFLHESFYESLGIYIIIQPFPPFPPLPKPVVALKPDDNPPAPPPPLPLYKADSPHD